MKKTILLLLVLLMSAPPRAQLVKIVYPQYTSIYDTKTLCPAQVTYVLKANDIGDTKREPNWRFSNDIPRGFRSATHGDFSNSGYDRGHLCPAQDRSFSRAAMRATFRMSNVAPQVPTLNRGSWKQTENSVRFAASIYDSLCVLVVPIFLDRDTARIGRNGVCVPHGFFKAVWVAGTDSVINSWFFFNK